MDVAALSISTRKMLGFALCKSAVFGLFLAIAMLCTSVFNPALAQSFSFSNVTVEGNERVDAATIISYTGIERGTPVSAGQLNDAYQRVVDSALF